MQFSRVDCAEAMASSSSAYVKVTWAEVVRGAGAERKKEASDEIALMDCVEFPPLEKASYRSSQFCGERLVSSGASKDVLLIYSLSKNKVPKDEEVKFSQLPHIRKFFWTFIMQKTLVTKNKHYDISKVSTLLTVIVHGMVECRSWLMQEVRLFVVTVYFIFCKTEDRHSAYKLKDLAVVEKQYAHYAGEDMEKFKSNLNKRIIFLAEIECFKCIDWKIPTFCSYDMLSCIFLRTLILNNNSKGDQIERAWQLAAQEVMKEILDGNDCGFLTAKNVARTCLTRVGFLNDGLFNAVMGNNSLTM